MEPISPSVRIGHADTMRARSVSLARRLLSGAGRASLVAYDLAPLQEAGALCHGLSAGGHLVVACLADDEAPATTWDEGPLRVRLDVIKEAPEWAVRITACAVHLLGVLEWLPAELLPSYLDGAELDPRLVELATSVGGRLGVVRTDRVLVHDSAGVLPLSFDEAVGRSFPDAGEEWLARDLIGRLTPGQLAALVEVAASEWGAGATLSTREETACSHTEGQVFCVDVDRTGLSLMAVEPTRVDVHFLPFDRPADTIDELTDQLGQLVDVWCGQPTE